MYSDATRCAVCGGEFSSKRVIIDGQAMHARCSVMSYGSHTPDDMARLGNKLWDLYNAAKNFESCLSSDCDGPERDALRIAIAAAYALPMSE